MRNIAKRGIYGVLSPIYAMTTWISGLMPGGASYPSTDPSNKTARKLRPHTSTADSALAPNLTLLVAQARQIERGTSLGRACVTGFAAELVGSGITILPDTKDAGINKTLKDAFEDWAEHAMYDGSDLWSWQSACARELCTAGAALARVLVLPERIKRGWLPVCIMPLEVEWLSWTPINTVADRNSFIKGIELDVLGRPVKYHLRHPHLMSGGEVVPANEVIHVFEKRRPQQTHGEPILAPAIVRILQDDNIVVAELDAIQATTAPAVILESENGLPDGENSTSDDPEVDIEAGSIFRARPGEKHHIVENKRITEDVKPFRSEIRGDVAAAMGISQWWLSRDVSNANYTSMRTDQLLTKRGNRGISAVLGNGVAGRPYLIALPWLAMSLGIPATTEMERYLLRPDQPEYVDPVKDIAAAGDAVDRRLSTRGAELQSRGKDFDQVTREIEAEEGRLDEILLSRIKNVQSICEKANKDMPGLGLHWSHIVTIAGAATAPGAYLSGVAQSQNSMLDVKKESEDADDKDEEGKETKDVDADENEN